MKYVGKVQSRVNSEVVAVASGTLPSGQPIVVNSDGTVSSIGISTAALGSITQFEAGATTYIAGAYDTTNNKVVLNYRDAGNSNYNTAIVGTVSGTSISFGSPAVVTSAYNSYQAIVFDSNAEKFAFGYINSAGSSQFYFKVGTVSGTDISFGSAGVASSSSTSSIAVTFDSGSNKVIAAFVDSASSDVGRAVVGTISSTSISFGTEQTFNNAATTVFGEGISYDSSANKTVIAFRDTGNSNQGTAVVATVSGTNISFGSESIFETGATQDIVCLYDPDNNKTNIFYMDGGNSDYGTAVIGTISSTDITFTSPQIWYNDAGINGLAGVYDTAANKNVLTIRGASAYGYAIPITSDGSTFTVGSSTTITTNAYGTYNHTAAVFDPDTGNTIFAFADGDDSDKGKAAVFDTPATNLTSANYIGISQGDVVYDLASQAVGDTSVFKSGSTTGFAADFDTSTGKVVVAFSDGTDGQKGKAVVGTVDAANNSISFGTAVTFQNSEITGDQMDCIFDSNANKVVIFYTDTNNPATNDRTGTAIVGTVSGTSISFGTKAAFESGNTQYINATFDSSNNKLVVVYKDADDSNQGKAAVGTISGTDISFGTPVVFESGNTTYQVCTFDSNSNKVVIAYKDGGNSDYGTSIVGTVSGTSISFGTAVVFESAHTTHVETIFDSSNNKVVIFYNDVGNSNYGTAIVGTVSGTSISYGSPVVFASGETEYIRGVYDSNAGKILLLFKDGGNTNRATIIIGTVSGTSISFGSEVVVMDVEGVSILPGVAFDSTNNKVVLAYIDTTGSDNAIAQVVQVAYDNTTRDNIADGNTVAISAAGSIAKNQNALTAGQEFFVQQDGTLALTADSPSVSAGLAVSATELIVKGK